MRKIIVFLIILIIPLFIYLQFLNKQVQIEPAYLDVEENLELLEDNIEAESTLEENDEEDKVTDNNEVVKNDQEDEVVQKYEDTEPNEDDPVKVETEQEKEVENTAENSTKSAVNYTTESGIDIVGEIDFDMNLEEEISEEDKIEAVKYAAKLDVPYLLGLLKDGITDEDKGLVAEHLRERLTEEEYNKTKKLILKYLFLLE